MITRIRLASIRILRDSDDQHNKNKKIIKMYSRVLKLRLLCSLPLWRVPSWWVSWRISCLVCCTSFSIMHIGCTLRKTIIYQNDIRIRTSSIRILRDCDDQHNNNIKMFNWVLQLRLLCWLQLLWVPSWRVSWQLYCLVQESSSFSIMCLGYTHS